MMLYMFTYWNKKLNCSSQITFDDHDPEVFKINILRACTQTELPKLKEARRLLRLLFIGTYDDETLKFEVCQEPVVLIDFDDVIAQREVALAQTEEVQKHA
jgi:hypothetical protein